jgi:predicted membrane chloride channel (bestrophin family)
VNLAFAKNKQNEQMLFTRAIACATLQHMRKKPPFKQLFDALTDEEKAKLASKADTSVEYLYQIANGFRGAGSDIISRLMAADRRITFQMMRRPN